MIVVGLSSGTSVDAIDVAVADLRLLDDPGGSAVSLAVLGSREVPYAPELRRDVLSVLPPSPVTIEDVGKVDTKLGHAFAAAARSAVDDLAGGHADLVVSHGQTVHHWVEDGRVLGTLQLGQPAWIAEATGLPVVSDLRVADVAAGGQGAPLVSILDALLLAGRDEPAAALNLGGIANVTVVSPGSDPTAFDTGPANALLDAVVRSRTDGTEHADVDGLRAGRGRIDQDLLAALLDDPYFTAPPPKSTGKERFGPDYLTAALGGRAEPPLDDLLATLVELTARTVAAALAPYGCDDVFASGGGTRNPVLMSRLSDQLAPTRLHLVDELGVDAATKEAVCFALMGFLTWHGLPSTLPSCTGARRATVAGRITPGADGSLMMPTPVTSPPTRLVLQPPAGSTVASGR